MEQWEREGLPPSCNLYEHFGLDRTGIYGPDLSPRRPRRTIGGDADTAVQVDEWGRTVQSWKQATAAPVNLADGVPDVTHPAAYLEQYAALDHRVIDPAQLQECRQCREAGDFTAVSPMEPA